MRVDLAQLLQNRPICHPTNIIATTLVGPELRVRVAGHPWWDQRPDRASSQQIEFVFGGVSQGVLVPFDFYGEEEDLEPFSVVEARVLPWAQPIGIEIFCNTSLSNPFEVYRVVHDFLVSVDALRQPQDYLNCAHTLTEFARLARSRSFQLGKFPSALRDLVRTELDRQGVSCSELPTRFDRTGRLLVTIQRSQFFCESADAVFDD